jgi:hypothetical protein
MKQFFLFFACCLLFSTLQAQDTPVDTTIYEVVEEMPRFPGCERFDTTLQFKVQCSQASLLNFIAQNVRYPFEARTEGIQGTVVLRFVVEPDSTISNLEVMKDIGGGCAAEAIRVVSAMNPVGIRWVPGKQAGKSVRVRYVLPVKFRLEDPLPYVLLGRDSVYIEFDEPLSYTEGPEALTAFLKANLNYPEVREDTCYVGDMDVQIKVDPDGIVKVLDISDFHNLGPDFQFEAIQVVSSTFGKWKPAVFEGRMVPAAYDVTLEFYPDNPFCQSAVKDYQTANQIALEGLNLYNEGNQEEGLNKLSEAIELVPNNANFRYMRGQIYLNDNQFENACIDLRKVKDVLTTSYVDEVLPIICKGVDEEEEQE